MKHILITGATGFLGKEMVRQLLDNYDYHLCLLVRPSPGKTPEQRLKWVNAKHRDRVTCIEGDIEKKEVFTHAKDRTFCEDTINEVLHLAASVEFKESKRKEIFSANLEGTRHLLDIARGFKHLSCFNHISTAYVSGNRFSPEVIPEGVLEKPKAGYRNPYEESKHAAEQLVVDSGLPWTIMRPSIIVGSVDGSYFGDNTMYSVCNVLFNARLISMEQQGFNAADRTDIKKRITLDAPLVGRPHSRCNVINVDIVARMISTIMERHDRFGRFFHLTSPHTTPLQTFITPMLDLLNVEGIVYSEKQDVDPQKLSPPAAFVFHHLKTFSNYITEDDPTFSLENSAQVHGDDFIKSIPSFDEEVFRRLLRTFLVKTSPGYFMER